MVEAVSRDAEAVSPVQEVKNSVLGFANDFNDFQDDLKVKLAKQEERMMVLERKVNMAARPHLSAAAEGHAPHQKAMAAYLRTGDDDGLRGLELEEKALSSVVNSDGGYLVDPVTSDSIASVLSATASIRVIANVVQVEATSYDVLIDRSEAGAGWATEVADTTETSTPAIERIAIPLNELSALPKASQRLLDDSAFDVEGWLAGRIADKFARSEAAAFVAGDGVDKPTGFSITAW
jgi:HK97 family phage major capsid protein